MLMCLTSNRAAGAEGAERIVIDWLHEWPTVLGAGFIVACFLVPTLIGSAFLQPVIARLLRGEKEPNTPVALLLNAFTLYYGVLLALLSIAVFENYNKAQDTISREAASIVALYRNLGGYPEPIAKPARTSFTGRRCGASASSSTAAARASRRAGRASRRSSGPSS